MAAQASPVVRPDDPPARRVLLLVDIQRDFMDDGPVPVAGAYAILPAVEELASARGRVFGAVVATQDWHPPDHISFVTSHAGKKLFDRVEQREEGGGEKAEGEGAEGGPPPSPLWVTLFAPHCVAGSRGASLTPPLDAAPIDAVFRKGQLSSVESYSGFFDLGGGHDTGLDAYLRARGTRTLAVAGVATDYCVFATARDALRLGYRVVVAREAVAGVDARESERKLRELQTLGAEVVDSARQALDAVAK